MNIKWKMQHIRNSCASACLAMLLSKYNIDKEDYEIIEETYMSYLIKYDESKDFFTAGVMFQSPDVFNFLLCKYGLMFDEISCINWDDFLAKAEKLLHLYTPFMTGLNPKYISSGGYDKIRDNEKISRRHTIVIYKMDGMTFNILDPSGGLNRAKEYEYETIKDYVDIKISFREMQRAIDDIEAPFKIGFIKENIDLKSYDLNDYIDESIKAISKFNELMKNFEEKIVNIEDEEIYELYMRYVFRYIKPITVDLLSAFEAIQNKTELHSKIIKLLSEFQQVAIEFQRRLKTNAACKEKEGYFKRLTTYSKKLYNLYLKHIDSLK